MVVTGCEDDNETRSPPLASCERSPLADQARLFDRLTDSAGASYSALSQLTGLTALSLEGCSTTELFSRENVLATTLTTPFARLSNLRTLSVSCPAIGGTISVCG